MADIIHTAEGAATDTIATIAGDVGRVTATTEHQAEALVAHGEQLVNAKADIEWLKSRILDVEQTATSAPSQAIAELRAEIASLRSMVGSQTVELLDTLPPSGESTNEPETQPPPETPNEAEAKALTGPFAGLRRQLHRLL